MSKWLLYLMTRKGFKVLENIINNFDASIILGVISTTDNNVVNDYNEDIKNLCKKHNIRYYDKKDTLQVFNNDYKTLAIGWRWIIPNADNLIVIHDSLLPKYRGFAPLVSALSNGDKTIGATAITASSEYDTGDILVQKSTEIEYPIKIKDAIEIMADVYIEIVKELFIGFDKNIIQPIPQNNALATYSLWRDSDDYFINWSSDSDAIQRKIDALGDPFMGAKSFVNNKEIIITQAEVFPDVVISERESTIGKVIFNIDNYPVVVCGRGLLKIKEAWSIDSKQSILPLQKFRTRFGKF